LWRVASAALLVAVRSSPRRMTIPLASTEITSASLSGGWLWLRLVVEVLDVAYRGGCELFDLALADADTGTATDRGLRLLVAAPSRFYGRQLTHTVGVDLLEQVERRVAKVQVLVALGPIDKATDPHGAEDRLQRAPTARFHNPTAVVVRVAHLNSTRLVPGTQIKMVLIQLA